MMVTGLRRRELGAKMLDGRARGAVSRALAPTGRALERVGISADVLTVVGLLASVATALLIGSGHLKLAVIGLAASGLIDLLDGSVARNSGQASPRGAFFDSVSDRVSDAIVLGGVAWYLAGQGTYQPMLAFAAVALSMLISYERARAESLGYSAKGGIMERAERMVVLGVALFFDILVPALIVMIVLMAITALHRFVKVWRQASDLPPRPKFLEARHLRPPLRGARTGERAPVFARWREQRAPTARREARAARRSRP